jgi:hypothetical protein
MRPVILHYSLTMLLVGAIVAVAMLWTHLSHLHRWQGPKLVHLWATHGIHLGDLVALAVELLLVMALSIVVLAGFTRPR